MTRMLLFFFFDQHRYRSKTNQTHSFTFNFREIYRLIPKSSLTSLCRSKFLEMKLTSCIRKVYQHEKGRPRDQVLPNSNVSPSQVHLLYHAMIQQERTSVDFVLIIKPWAKWNKLHGLFLLTF